MTIATIDNLTRTTHGSDGRVLITKEYADANYSTGVGDMLKADYATTNPNIVDSAFQLSDGGTDIIGATDVYDHIVSNLVELHFSASERSAMDAANAPGIGNPLATINDLPVGSIVSSVTVDAGLVDTGTSTDPILSIRYSANAANLVQAANNGEGNAIQTNDVILYSDSTTGDTVFRGLVSDLPFTDNIGDITRVNITVGDGLVGSVDTTTGDHTQVIDIEYSNANNLVNKAATLSDPASTDYILYHDSGTAFARKSRLSNVSVRNLNDVNLMYDNEVNAYTKTQYFDATTGSASTSTYNIDLDSNQVHVVTLASNTEITVSNIKDGATYIILIKQPSSGGPYTVTWDAEFTGPSDVDPIMTATNGRADLFTFVGIGTDKLYGSFNQDYDTAVSG